MIVDEMKTTDPMDELAAMTEIAKALQYLDTESIRRVLIWASDRFDANLKLDAVQNVSTLIESDATGNDGDNSNTEDDEVDEFAEIADLFSRTSPKNDPEKALLAAYWFQHLNSYDDFDAATINKELKHLGHASSNITNALSSLMTRKPQLVIQTRKSGNSQQARKRYKLTSEGIKQVQRMLDGVE